MGGVDGTGAAAGFSFDAPPDTGCRFLGCLSARNSRNLLFANCAGWVSAAGEWIGSFFAKSVWGVLGGGAISALGNLISTWLVWERPWDRQVQHAAMEAFPVLATQVAQLEARMETVQRAVVAATAAAKQSSRSPGAGGAASPSYPRQASPGLLPPSHQQSPASKRANSRRNRANDAPLSVSVRVSVAPFAQGADSPSAFVPESVTASPSIPSSSPAPAPGSDRPDSVASSSSLEPPSTGVTPEA